MFHVDEDAYQLLDKYLTNLRIHFRKEEGSDEIMDDFEARISELLGERVRLGHEVITIEQVEEIIKRMGKPEEIFEEESDSSSCQAEREERQETDHAKATIKRRLMRDPDNRILGGVAGGFAAYMDWDPTAVRILLFILMFFYGVTIPIYFLLWIIVPLARTATEKLEMRGERVTVENIGKTVTDGFEKVSDNMSDYLHSDKPRNLLQRLADLFVQVVGFILKGILVIVAVILLPPLAFVLIGMVLLLFGFLVGGAGLLYQISPFGAELLNGVSLPLAVMGCVGTVLLFGIPLFALLYAVCGPLFKVRPLPMVARWVLLVVWLIGLALCGFYVHQSGVLHDWDYYWEGIHQWSTTI